MFYAKKIRNRHWRKLLKKKKDGEIAEWSSQKKIQKNGHLYHFLDFFHFILLSSAGLIPDFHDCVGQGSDPFDLDIHPVARHHRADPCRCACGDDIARIQGHDVGDEPHQEGHGKNQVPRAARLLQFSVEESFEPQPRRVDIRGDARADAGERIEGFCPGELHIFGLEVAGRHIVETGVAFIFNIMPLFTNISVILEYRCLYNRTKAGN